MKVGSKVRYMGQEYWVVAVSLSGIIEIAPTTHGAGSFYVLEDYLV